MTYRIIGRRHISRLNREQELEDFLNRLADKYKSFRVIAMTDTEILTWFDAKDFELYKTDRSQVQ